MFQPTNDSYLRFVIAATREQYMQEVDADRLARLAQPYQPSRLGIALHNLAHGLMSVGRWLDRFDQSPALLTQRH